VDVGPVFIFDMGIIVFVISSNSGELLYGPFSIRGYRWRCQFKNSEPRYRNQNLFLEMDAFFDVFDSLENKEEVI